LRIVVLLFVNRVDAVHACVVLGLAPAGDAVGAHTAVALTYAIRAKRALAHLHIPRKPTITFMDSQIAQPVPAQTKTKATSFSLNVVFNLSP
jgi:hypothetical protein